MSRPDQGLAYTNTEAFHGALAYTLWTKFREGHWVRQVEHNLPYSSGLWRRVIPTIGTHLVLTTTIQGH